MRRVVNRSQRQATSTFGRKNVRPCYACGTTGTALSVRITSPYGYLCCRTAFNIAGSGDYSFH